MDNKMYIFIMFYLTFLPTKVFSVFHQSEGFKLDSKLKDVKWQCETICAESGGKAEFNVDSKICKCLLGGNVDKMDLEVLRKNAMALDLILEVITPIPHTLVFKREVEENESTTSQPITSTTLNKYSSLEITTLINENPSGIVGQRSRPSTQRRKSNASNTQSTTVNPINGRIAASTTSLQQRQGQIIQQIRERLNRLSQNTLDQRGRQHEVDTIRILLRQLSQSIGVPEPSQRRSERLRTITQQVRERQSKYRLAHGPRVGASSNSHDKEKPLDENEPNENGIEVGKNGSQFLDEITPDPGKINDI